MRLRLAASLLIASLALGAPVLAQDQDGPIATASEGGETAEALRAREAIAYATPLPRGAPTDDYVLVAWCAARVEGHIALGRSLATADDLDRELIQLGQLEATDFRDALAAGRSRQTRATLAAAEAAAEQSAAQWAPLLALEGEAERSQSFGYFSGLPGRCEHAARRIRENITTPPSTLEEAGLDEVGMPLEP